ncbi:LuxR C-terminal-related transcriptional regulator [Christiangramia sediminicola]|uniref:LuxR C-terminal-related transcriptional regulator n=1 Tax=Christiangramia sediminicola TaxID=3073267 RepID=A0ABU1EQR0_9FLAO|nr:LuxR C-terminal-related transcriptional regulator [Christiangramia sp. SM2212]MDR5590498.1 LuxR C-terminal-related transcriptional regulator [Christiangramia sp. SM2212]
MKNNFQKYDILEFCNEIADFHGKPLVKDEYLDLEKFPLQEKQCIYILNWSLPAITYTRGVKDLLGYTDNEFTLNVALTNIHPDDLDLANRITRATVSHCCKHGNSRDSYLNVTYRIKRKDGIFIKVLRQSGLYLGDENNNLISNYSVLTDISFMNYGNTVDWEIKANELNTKNFHSEIYKEFSTLFSKREKEIILQIHDGLSNSDISKKLNLSPHTVSTHRKNILRKSNCNSKESLIFFCIRNGVIQSSKF